jgi:putative PEP-CTERM system histidine kinase
VPRQIVFYSFVAICAGFFVTFLLLSDYYIRTLGGTWVGAIRIVLFVAAFMVAAVVTVSSTVRARIRVFLTKSFFQYKYDYRKEWLRFIGTLSGSELDNVANTAVRAIAQIVNSPGGIACVQEEEDVYSPIGAWGSSLPKIPNLPKDASLIRFLKKRQWVIDLQEMHDDPARYEGLDLDGAFSDENDWWLIVPMFIGQRLLGFIVLQRPRIVPSLNFEDHDLLKTVGRHAATHIDQAESDKRLAESRQFGAYNRLTAFLMHDLNNLIAQQSLVVKNAEKYRHNPKFVDDAIDTIANSVTRMRRLMEQLTNTSAQSGKRKVRLNDVVSKATSRTSLGAPKPELRTGNEEVFIEADPDRLAAIVENLIRNAQDATPSDGEILIDLEPVGTMGILRIRDSGCGMASDFIRERLFRPFDSTKGSESMGIGAYQAREYVRQIGGQLSVTSELGRGTTFSIELPLVRGR